MNKSSVYKNIIRSNTKDIKSKTLFNDMLRCDIEQKFITRSFVSMAK